MDVLLGVILIGFFCIVGGFGSYGCYRCCTDEVWGDTRIHSETSMERQERFKRFKKKGHFCSCFRSQGRICGKSAASTTSFTGTIYSVGSSVYGSEGECWRKEEDGKVPFDILDSLGKIHNIQTTAANRKEFINRSEIPNYSEKTSRAKAATA